MKIHTHIFIWRRTVMAKTHWQHSCSGPCFLFALLAGLLLICGLATSALAQGGANGAIAGTIKDPSGAAVAGAQVDIVNQQTEVTVRTVTTNANGGFNVTLLPIGTYK